MRGIPTTATAFNLLEFIYDILIEVKSQPDAEPPKTAWPTLPTNRTVAILPILVYQYGIVMYFHRVL